VPVLVTPEKAIGESGAILEWADQRTGREQRLFPADPELREQTHRLCRRFDDVLGPSGRRLIYVHMLAEPKLALRFNNQGVPRWEDRALRWGWPVAVKLVRRVLDIRPGVEVEDEQVVWREFEFVAETLSRSGPYLCGERFGAADLTFAALAAPIVAPPVYGVPLPQPDVLPPATAELIRRGRAHPAGAFALDVVSRHRRERVN
jgi:glutathione S-transferase